MMGHYILLFVNVVLLTPGTFGIHTSCDDGWVPYEGFCYWFGTDSPHFYEAEHYCRQHVSHLIEVSSQLENAFIKDEMRKHKATGCYWLGMTDELTEGVWRWYNSHSRPNFTDWHPSQPGHDGEEDCCVFWAAFNFQWGDYGCLRSCEAVCKRRGFGEETSEIIG